MSFHAYHRGRRLGLALARLGAEADVLGAGLDAGWESASGFASALGRVAGRPPGRARGTTVALACRLPTPMGPMVAAATEEGLGLLEFADRRMLERQLETLRRRLDAVLLPGRNEHVERLQEQLEAYFAGERVRFDVPLVLPGTPFQREVWSALRAIPRGSTTSYGELARRLGRPEACRAVARANGDNRVAILVPCHRVIGSDDRISGYGGGRWRKQRLLELEGAWPRARRPRSKSTGPVRADTIHVKRRSSAARDPLS
jgi:AraC family transcriptional regulator of adaptative response/methylated-DNA-[protein]-cysteine methyltransferase